MTKSFASSLIRPDLDEIHCSDHEADEAHERQTPGNLYECHEDAFELSARTYNYARNW